jgi:cysteine desulfurase
MKNIVVSNVSACSSAKVKPSQVLKEMGLSDDEAFTSPFFIGKIQLN